MSLLFPHAGIVTPAGPSGKSPVDDLYAKWTVAAAVFFITFVAAVLARQAVA
jgi:hypothetical protein